MPLRPNDTLQGKLNSYQILETLGQGTYGITFRAITPEGEFRTAKEFFDTGSTTPQDVAYQEACFRREAQILMANRSPHIVFGYELIDDQQGLFFVMEWIQGDTLRKHFTQHLTANSNQPFPQEVVVPIGIALCEAIDYLHKLPGQIIYRDLKPENVMWDAANKRVRLIDFGTARFSARSKKVTQGLGTQGYAPPELYASRGEVTFSADVYTIGATLYELLTGETPPEFMTPVNFRGYDAKISPALQKTILKALQQRPEARFQTAAAMGEALLASGAVPASPEPPLEGKLKNPHPALACLCQKCGATPKGQEAVYCPRCGDMYSVVMLRVFSKTGAPVLLYLNKEEAMLGREDPERRLFPDIDLKKFDSGRHVSRSHAKIQRKGGKFYLTALQTTNPTRLNGYLVSPGATVEIENEARLELADLVANFVVMPVAKVA